jgi:hypothetical protein
MLYFGCLILFLYEKCEMKTNLSKTLHEKVNVPAALLSKRPLFIKFGNAKETIKQTSIR